MQLVPRSVLGTARSTVLGWQTESVYVEWKDDMGTVESTNKYAALGVASKQT
jgi:hypothetical protein